MNIPNLLTLCRILLVPVVLVLLFRAGQAGSTLACVLFVIAALTDWFDGYL
ncbi:MAG: CDP-alcohol phosphatidyltransferase family protein, partial [Gammaproteobacteria bacterium]|nr:CDP-alcohol phosphatidyltransferase family protein [Gammaproteobacteria bacterium]